MSFLDLSIVSAIPAHLTRRLCKQPHFVSPLDEEILLVTCIILIIDATSQGLAAIDYLLSYVYTGTRRRGYCPTLALRVSVPGSPQVQLVTSLIDM